jgi:hypothetical protein
MLLIYFYKTDEKGLCLRMVNISILNKKKSGTVAALYKAALYKAALYKATRYIRLRAI